MADLDRDALFVEEAAALRPLLERCARVLYPGVDGGHRRADRAVDQALARTYALSPDGDRRVAAFRALLHPSWPPARAGRVDGQRVGAERVGAERVGGVRVGAERVELLDVAPLHTGRLIDDLAALGPTSQAVVVLSLLGGLTVDEIGRVIRAPRTRVAEEFRDAVDRVARTDPSRRDLRELSRQLARLAGPADATATAHAGVGDLALGRQLERRAHARRGFLAAAAAALVALVAGFAVRGDGRGGEVADVPPSPTPTASPTQSDVSDPWRSYRCDVSSADCRTLRTARWRSRTAEVIVQHLDQKRAYFSDMTFTLRPGVESESFWLGRSGALDLTVSRAGTGGTEVYLQIATDAKHADRCGQRIKQKCHIHRSMDGNSYLVGGNSTSGGGVEVQFSAGEERVVSVVARTVSAGDKLEITSGDLIKLVSDSRLRLPRR